MKLYYHKTSGGAEYLFDTFIKCENGHKEGVLNDNTKYVIRIDGDITKDAELMLREVEEDEKIIRVEEMEKYERELQELKPHDEVQGSKVIKGYQFIYTAGHGYLVVPVGDNLYMVARRLQSYGFLGQYAVYLEEDSEMPEFLKDVK